jgi:hypothetical protein
MVTCLKAVLLLCIFGITTVGDVEKSKYYSSDVTRSMLFFGDVLGNVSDVNKETGGNLVMFKNVIFFGDVLGSY